MVSLIRQILRKLSVLGHFIVINFANFASFARVAIFLNVVPFAAQDALYAIIQLIPCSLNALPLTITFTNKNTFTCHDMYNIIRMTMMNFV